MGWERGRLPRALSPPALTTFPGSPQNELCPRQRPHGGLTPTTMLIKEYRICMPLTTEEVSGGHWGGRHCLCPRGWGASVGKKGAEGRGAPSLQLWVLGTAWLQAPADGGGGGWGSGTHSSGVSGVGCLPG